jgi:transcriptional regulator with XRE-family HTH domain
MPRTAPTLFPATARQLAALGQRLRVARLRRSYSAQSVAQRAGIARATLYRVEEGDPGVSMATYASVLRVLSLQDDLDLVARDDTLGRKLQDLNLPVRKTAPRRTAAAPATDRDPTPSPLPQPQP